MRIKSFALALAGLGLGLFWLMGWTACKGKKAQGRETPRDTTITVRSSFNNLFLDSTERETFWAQHPEMGRYAEEMRGFYLGRNDQFAWFDTAGLTEAAHGFYHLQSNYLATHGDSSLYYPAFEKAYQQHLQQPASRFSSKDLMATELFFTAQFYAYAARVFQGADLDLNDLGWFIPRKKTNLTALLDSLLLHGKSELVQKTVLSKAYQQLDRALQDLSQRAKQYPSPLVASPQSTWELGMQDSALLLVKQHLSFWDTTYRADSLPLFDSAMFQAVKNFQGRQGLPVTGKLGGLTIKALQVPLGERIQQILINLERMRWTPEHTASAFMVVNIPEYKLHVYDSNRLQFDMNVIVGTEANNTVIFSGLLQYIVFAPYWNVPSSIVRNEMLPAMARDKNYLARNNMETTGYSGGLPVVRQLPGPKNALGRVKFLFPNNYSIYFHDTPNRNLFARSSRSLSHGCIRLGDPVKFAHYLLRNDTVRYPAPVVDSLLASTKEKWVTLRTPVPVFLVYFTAWVDGAGQLQFRPDIYGHDKKMKDKLFTR